MMQQQLDSLYVSAQRDFAACSNLADLEQAKARVLGKNGSLTILLKQLGSCRVEDRPRLGAAINTTKQQVELALQQRRECLLQEQQARKLAKECLDVTLPARGLRCGALHPVSLTMQRIQTLFHSMGFDVAEGPEIESDFYNFTALNIPDNHPARAMHDTFYVDEHHVLRTHTSPVQVHYMQHHKPPLRVIAQGRVYRVDSDATHSPMFHQVEGLWVDERVSFANLKGLVIHFLQQFFEQDDLQVRFRPSFFPFTEPSAEIDMRWGNGWLEIGGCGMVHPRVFQNVGIDTEQYRGFAFGLGIERLTMLRYGVKDLRLFFDHDLRFLEQFSKT